MIIDTFPVIYSTLDSKALVSRVLPCYEIDTVVECQFWHRGLSDVYLVETRTTQYILRVSHCHWRSQMDIHFELELLDFLRQRSIPIAYPLRTADGQLSIEIDALEGKRYAALFIYAPGKIALGDLNIAQGHKLGETVAKLHRTAAEFHSQFHRQPLSLEYLLDDSLHAIAPFLRQNPYDLQYLIETIDQIKDQLQSFPKESPFWGICWGDPHSGNAHFTPENDVTLFDFDQCGYGWRIFEIAKFWQSSLNAGISSKIRDAFLAGYQTIQPITNEETSALQMFTITAHIWVWAICLNYAVLHNYSRLDHHYFHHRLEQLKMLKSPEWQLF
jgi:Ser/Thr protein kinase RdoA (MazF antagonist)